MTKIGGVSNSGKISARQTGIFAGGHVASGGSVTLEMFSGGIRNTGTIRGQWPRHLRRRRGRGQRHRGDVGDGGRRHHQQRPDQAGGSAPAVMIGGLASGSLSSEASVTVETFSGGVRNTGTIWPHGTPYSSAVKRPSAGRLRYQAFRRHHQCRPDLGWPLRHRGGRRQQRRIGHDSDFRRRHRQYRRHHHRI